MILVYFKCSVQCLQTVFCCCCSYESAYSMFMFHMCFVGVAVVGILFCCKFRSLFLYLFRCCCFFFFALNFSLLSLHSLCKMCCMPFFDGTTPFAVNFHWFCLFCFVSFKISLKFVSAETVLFFSSSSSFFFISIF